MAAAFIGRRSEYFTFSHSCDVSDSMCIVHDVPNSNASEIPHDGALPLTDIEPTQVTLVRTLCFFSPPPDGSKPFNITQDLQKDGSRNYLHHQTDVNISDIRGHETDFCLAVHGFAAISNFDVGNLNLLEKASMEALYIPKVTFIY